MSHVLIVLLKEIVSFRVPFCSNSVFVYVQKVLLYIQVYIYSHSCMYICIHTYIFFRSTSIFINGKCNIAGTD